MLLAGMTKGVYMFFPMLNIERISHSFKTALACLIGFVITQLFYFEIEQWLIITIVVVMCAQISVGSVIQKSYARFLGTLVGSVIALFSISFFHQDEVVYGMVIAISAMIFSYVATGEKNYAEAGTLGAATVVIILIGKNPTIRSALERFLEINLGILIATLVSQFILPIHARKHLRELQAKTIRQLRTFYQLNQVAVKGIENLEDYQKLEEDIVQLLIKQRKLSADAAREPIGEVFKTIHFQQLLYAERGILRSITIMHYIMHQYADFNTLFSNIEFIKQYQEKISVLFEKIANYLENEATQQPLDEEIPDITIFKEYIFAIEVDYTKEKLEYINAYLFAVEMLLDHLSMLLKLLKQV